MTTPPTSFPCKQLTILYHKDKHNFQKQHSPSVQHYGINNQILVQSKHVQKFWQISKTNKNKKKEILLCNRFEYISFFEIADDLPYFYCKP